MPTPSKLLTPEEVWECLRTGADYVIWSVGDGHSCCDVRTYLDMWGKTARPLATREPTSDGGEDVVLCPHGFNV